jgi:hypothetical protein
MAGHLAGRGRVDPGQAGHRGRPAAADRAGLFLITIWAVIVPCIVIERARVFSCSAEPGAGQGNGWNVFGILVITFLILFAAQLILGLILSPLSQALSTAISTVVTGALIAPFQALVVTTIYFRLIGVESGTAPAQPQWPGGDRPTRSRLAPQVASRPTRSRLAPQVAARPTRRLAPRAARLPELAPDNQPQAGPHRVDGADLVVDRPVGSAISDHVLGHVGRDPGRPLGPGDPQPGRRGHPGPGSLSRLPVRPAPR